MTFRDQIMKIGLRPCAADECLFIRGDGVTLAIHVDDIIITGPRKVDVDAAIEQIMKAFTVTGLGDVSYYLGMKISRDIDGLSIRLTQEAYIRRILDTVDPKAVKTAHTPMQEGNKYYKATDHEADASSRHLYQAKLGSVMYPMMQTRLDLAFTSGKLARYSSNPDHTHQTVLMRVFHYLHRHPDYGITLRPHRGDDDVTLER
jgi:hypothetical protein